MLSFDYPVYLASSSPRRKEILKKIITNFSILSPEAWETNSNNLEAEKVTKKNSLTKLLIAQKIIQDPVYLVIAADTVVSVFGEIFGKPINREDAYRMWKVLEGKTHEVVTGVSILFKNQKKIIWHTYSEKAYVTFQSLTSEEITLYIEKNEPFDKAGAYGIQELPNYFIHKIDGDINTIIGLPLYSLQEVLERYSQ
jgi:septum formation protein